MDYDYQRYEQVIIELLKASWRDPDDLEIGRDISDQPEVKWSINQLDDHLDDGEGCMTAEEVMAILEHLYEYYFKPWEGKFENDPETGLPLWPFNNIKP